jgi:hypothetical protein
MRQGLLQNKNAPNLLRPSAAHTNQLVGASSKSSGDVAAALMGVKLIHGEGNVFKGSGVIIKPNLNSYMELSKPGAAPAAAGKPQHVDAGEAAGASASSSAAAAAAAVTRDEVMDQCEEQLLRDGVSSIENSIHGLCLSSAASLLNDAAGGGSLLLDSVKAAANPESLQQQHPPPFYHHEATAPKGSHIPPETIGRSSRSNAIKRLDAGVLRAAHAFVQLAPPAAAAALASSDVASTSSSSSSAAAAASAAASAVGGLVPADPPGYRALPRALQNKFDAAWSSLEMPVMQKLALVIKYSSEEDEAMVAKACAAWTAAKDCVLERERMLVAYNSALQHTEAAEAALAAKEADKDDDDDDRLNCSTIPLFVSKSC